MRGFLLTMLVVALLVGGEMHPAARASDGPSVYQRDFEFYWQTFADNFAYFDGERPRARWDRVHTIYARRAANVTEGDGFIRLLEEANNELFNGHITLEKNLPSSNRIIPTGADLWAEREHGQFVIVQVRPGFNADLCGLRPGMVLKAFNGVPIRIAMRKFLPRSTSTYTDEMNEYALNMLLAGAHDTPRTIVVLSGGRELTFRPDRLPNRTERPAKTLLSSKLLAGGIGYIKVNNSLGNVDVLQAFDRALDSLTAARGIILDLTDTPSGGTTTVARGILGRFVSAELPYQKLEYPDELRLFGVRRAQFDLVSPRGSVYRKPVVVLANRWTGSVGEALVIGFVATTRAQVVGSKMAGLLGAICAEETPETKIGFSVPCQRTIEVDGTPREAFLPRVGSGTPNDIIIAERLIRMKAEARNRP